MGLSTNIPFLIQQKVQMIAALSAHYASVASNAANGVAVAKGPPH